ncbi:MAG: hypothetical protein A4E53_00202 [Pelotomaculum sp. PtaB.Bin104]|nr:MAG: hypothetical protein A4E53_00202 [Pelotomaculum sp. PtaB.Bin104]
MIKFDMELRNIEFFVIEEGFQRELIYELQEMDGLKYKFICSSPTNSCQFDSTLDNEINKLLISNGHNKLLLQFSQSPVSIDYDFCLDIGGKTIVFEIEKANKEKVLYDYLKFHIYMEYGVNASVLLAPKNWVHTHGVYNLFDTATQRLSLCHRYGMGSPSKLRNILVVGFNQVHNGQILNGVIYKEMKKKAREAFTQSKKG